MMENKNRQGSLCYNKHWSFRQSLRKRGFSSQKTNYTSLNTEKWAGIEEGMEVNPTNADDEGKIGGLTTTWRKYNV